MKKRSGIHFISIVLVIFLSLSAVFVIVPGEIVAAQDGDFIYTLDGDPLVATIIGYTGAGGEITIPSTLDGYTTAAIGDQSFENCDSLTSVMIPSSVTTIGEGAFASCANLNSATIPSSVSTIGMGAFLYCYALTSIDVNASNLDYASIDGVLYNKTTTALIQCPGGMEGTFTIPDSVTSIGFKAFNACPFLTSIVIPDSVTYIGDYAFFQCASLTSIDVNASNLDYASIDGVLYNKTTTALIQCPGGMEGTFTIPSSVTTIGVWAFSYCTSLTSMIVSENVTTIGFAAFYSCTSLSSITFSGLIAPITVGSNWITDTDPGIMGHAYAASNFPVQGSTFNGLMMGAAIPIVPGAPTDLSATPNNVQVVLEWTAPSSDGGSAITGYKVYRSAMENGTYTMIASPSGSNYTDTDLTNGQTYWYKVTAENANGEGVQSTAISATVPGNDNTILMVGAVIAIAIALLAVLFIVRTRKS